MPLGAFRRLFLKRREMGYAGKRRGDTKKIRAFRDSDHQKFAEQKI
jgi:hypothetical protein